MPESGEDYKVIIKADKTPVGEHERRFNAAVMSEVAILIVGQEFEKRDIIMEKRNNSLLRIRETYRTYDSQYPLIFWEGQDGYTLQIPHPITGAHILGKIVSSMDFYAYHFMLRKDGYNTIQRCKNLFHQFVVDMYVKIRLNARYSSVWITKTPSRWLHPSPWCYSCWWYCK